MAVAALDDGEDAVAATGVADCGREGRQVGFQRVVWIVVGVLMTLMCAAG